MEIKYSIKKNRTAENQFSGITIKDKVHFPYTIYWTCPLCDKENEANLETNSILTWPVLNDTNSVIVECKDCDFNTKISFLIEVNIKKVI